VSRRWLTIFYCADEIFIERKMLLILQKLKKCFLVQFVLNAVRMVRFFEDLQAIFSLQCFRTWHPLTLLQTWYFRGCQLWNLCSLPYFMQISPIKLKEFIWLDSYSSPIHAGQRYRQALNLKDENGSVTSNRKPGTSQTGAPCCKLDSLSL
jgi:hypothetical protein